MFSDVEYNLDTDFFMCSSYSSIPNPYVRFDVNHFFLKLQI